MSLFNPSTGEDLGKVENTSPEKIEEMFIKARKSQVQWSQTSFSDRAKYMYKMKQYITENKDKIASIISKSTGKTLMDALATEVLPATLACDWYASNAEEILKRKYVKTGHILFSNKVNSIEFLPVGVVGIISPWNYPFSIPFGEIVMGLMAGNSIILKVASNVTLVGNEIENIIKYSGLPEGLFSHVVCSGSQVSKLFFKNKVDKIFFTGSVPIGKQLIKECAETMTPLSLELGGKDPMIVFPDANLERATNCCCWAAVQNAGQSCAGIERVYVHETIYDEFIDLMTKKVNALRHGVDDGKTEVDMGSMTTLNQLKTVESQVKEALEKGAKIIAQSKAVGDVSKGFFYPATLMVDVNHKMKIMTDETFGPIIPVMKFKTSEEAIELANDSEFGLTSSVWTYDIELADYVSKRLVTGATTINDHLYSHGCSETPWGGPKKSGWGRTHSELGLKEMCNAKTLCWEGIPSLPRNMWWYPFDSNTYKGMSSVFSLTSPSGIVDFLKGIWNVTPFALGRMTTNWEVGQKKETKKHWIHDFIFVGMFFGFKYFAK